MGELRWSAITSNYMQSVYWRWVADVCLEAWRILSVTNDFIMYMQTEARSRGSRDNHLAAFEHIKNFQDVPISFP